MVLLYITKFSSIGVIQFFISSINIEEHLLPHSLRNSRVRLCATLWTETYQAPLSMRVLRARILEWLVELSSRGFSQPRDWTLVSGISGRFFTTEPPGKSLCAICEIKMQHYSSKWLCRWPAAFIKSLYFLQWRRCHYYPIVFISELSVLFYCLFYQLRCQYIIVLIKNIYIIFQYLVSMHCHISLWSSLRLHHYSCMFTSPPEFSV